MARSFVSDSGGGAAHPSVQRRPLACAPGPVCRVQARIRPSNNHAPTRHDACARTVPPAPASSRSILPDTDPTRFPAGSSPTTVIESHEPTPRSPHRSTRPRGSACHSGGVSSEDRRVGLGPRFTAHRGAEFPAGNPLTDRDQPPPPVTPAAPDRLASIMCSHRRHFEHIGHA